MSSLSLERPKEAARPRRDNLAWRRMEGKVLRVLVTAAALVTLGCFVGVVGYTVFRGVPYINTDMFRWKYTSDNMSVLPSLISTVLITLVGLLVSAPIGIFGAVYLVEYAPRGSRLASFFRLTTETLSGIPSIVYGLFGMLFFVFALGWDYSILSGAFTVAIMVLPTIIRTTQESLKTVPQSYREGALGLGATKWHIVRTLVLPCSLDGIVSGCILAVGRIVGESAALLFTAGTGKVLASSIAKAYTSSGATLSVALYMTVSEDGDFAVGYAIAAVLMVLVLCLNGLAKLARKKLKRDM